MTAPLDSGPSFGQWLKRRRRALNLTQDALALRIGYTGATLQKLEQDARRPSRALVALLSDALELAPHERDHFLRLARAASGDRALSAMVADAIDQPPWRRVQPPRPSIELIGRAAEHAALIDRLCGGQRLVTVTGPGGIGKTSLAQQVAADLAANTAAPFPDGVAVVLLAALTTVDEIAPAIAKALGLSLQGARSSTDHLIDLLAPRALLLVLDNCEQFLDLQNGQQFAALLGRLLSGAPQLALLATSRERLRLRDEHVLSLGGLALPAVDGGPRVERAASVQLFVERARQVNPAFAFGDEDRAAVARVCRQLDGTPLAIELAAAWTRALTLREIAVEVDRALDFLTSDARDVADRHRSLRATLDHSWRLLDDAERQALARLSVFRGAFDREAAEEVAGASLPLLAALIDKSLVRTSVADGAMRYVLHELVRQGVAERLAADPAERRATEARHAAYYADLLGRLVLAQTGGSSPAAWASLVRNLDNLRAAWLWAAAAGETEIVLAMVRGLQLLYDGHSWLLDGAALFGQAAEALRQFGARAAVARGRALGAQGASLMRAGRLAAAQSRLEEGLGLLQAAGATSDAAELVFLLGVVALHRGRFDEAQAGCDEAMRLAEATGNQFTQLWARLYHGMIGLLTGDFATAERDLVVCRDAWRLRSFQRGLAVSLVLLAEAGRLSGRAALTEMYVHEGLQVASASRDQLMMAWCLRELGARAIERQDIDEARYLLAESCESLRALEELWIYGRSRALLVWLDVRRGDHLAARQGCAEMIQTVHGGELLLLADIAYGLALSLAADDCHVEALAALLALDGAPGEHATLQLADGLRAELAQRLDSAGRAAAVALAGSCPPLELLEMLCARRAAPKAAPKADAPPEAPSLPRGAYRVAETGEVLSPREVEVLRLLIAGANNQTIADNLVISLYTAKHHVASVLHKLGVANRTEAALRGRALGLPPLPPR